MPACKITSGVTKSGSPMPRLMTSCIVAAMSKNLRIPDGGTDSTLFEMRFCMGIPPGKLLGYRVTLQLWIFSCTQN